MFAEPARHCKEAQQTMSTYWVVRYLCEKSYIGEMWKMQFSKTEFGHEMNGLERAHPVGCSRWFAKYPAPLTPVT
jgi:hypothetical protein